MCAVRLRGQPRTRASRGNGGGGSPETPPTVGLRTSDHAASWRALRGMNDEAPTPRSAGATASTVASSRRPDRPAARSNDAQIAFGSGGARPTSRASAAVPRGSQSARERIGDSVGERDQQLAGGESRMRVPGTVLRRGCRAAVPAVTSSAAVVHGLLTTGGICPASAIVPRWVSESNEKQTALTNRSGGQAASSSELSQESRRPGAIRRRHLGHEHFELPGRRRRLRVVARHVTEEAQRPAVRCQKTPAQSPLASSPLPRPIAIRESWARLFSGPIHVVAALPPCTDRAGAAPRRSGASGGPVAIARTTCAAPVEPPHGLRR